MTDAAIINWACLLRTYLEQFYYELQLQAASVLYYRSVPRIAG
jgi:hypothetical protein